MLALYIALVYFTIGAISGRYTWRTAKRMVNKKVDKWVEGPTDYWYGFFAWPVIWPLYISMSVRETKPSFVGWLMCAREPKKVRKAAQVAQLERELELDK